MNFKDIIIKKRDGLELNQAEIEFTVRGISSGSLPVYQIAAWAMAVYFQGMSEMETEFLTKFMAASGQVLDLSRVEGICVDKHSTGGVGDKTTLVVIPLVAAAGVPVAKMSGRGLGHTGGTIDKLESIPGFKVDLKHDEFIGQINRIKAAVISQSGNLVPADKILYALRDVTGTVESRPLIASSVMSKKIAAGAKGMILDVKAGSGAFMKNKDEARRLAELMVKIGKKLNREMVAVLSCNDQPLGRAVGNALEVKEALDTLKGAGPADLTELSVILAAHMLMLGHKFTDFAEAEAWVKKAIKSGAGFAKLQDIVSAQGGKLRWEADDYGLGTAEWVFTVTAEQEGYVRNLDAYALGNIAMNLGAGRKKIGDIIDHKVGLEILVKNNQPVAKGQDIAKIYASSETSGLKAQRLFSDAYTITDSPAMDEPLIWDIIT
ncbi:MAG: thymidine phosphorylase [Syntrophomonadaceae bacterium]|jgi:pyrimidine-nucleoside phosphorylase|nr:thymidine phosphorylase [Syntrophomonadaceae bacterium]